MSHVPTRAERRRMIGLLVLLGVLAIQLAAITVIWAAQAAATLP